MGNTNKSATKSASRLKAKPRRAPRPAGEPAKPARPGRDYSIAAVARTLDLLEALAVVGPAPLATVIAVINGVFLLIAAPAPEREPSDNSPQWCAQCNHTRLETA